MTEIMLASADGAIERAAALIRAGELVAFPTETVYGLGANALDATATAKIFTAKGRPNTDPLIVHIADLDQLAALITDADRLLNDLAAKFWPGPLTLILKRSRLVPDLVSAGLPTVAVRMPAHPVALALIRAAGVPIAAPSANRFAHTSPTTAQHVYADLVGRISLILDGGPTAIGVESTILDITARPLHILRPGGVSLEALQNFIPDFIARDERHIDAERNTEALPAPGMLLKHYSPNAHLILIEGGSDAVQHAIIERTRALVKANKHVGLLLAEEDRASVEALDVPKTFVGGLTDMETIARNLFAALRALDDTGVDMIIARGFPVTGIGAAVRDRLVRAASGQVVHV